MGHGQRVQVLRHHEAVSIRGLTGHAQLLKLALPALGRVGLPRCFSRRLGYAAAGSAVAAVAALALASPAAAAAGAASAFGLACTGVVNCGPIAVSNYPAGPTSATVADATVPPSGAVLAKSGVLSTTAAASGATAAVASVAASLSSALSLSATAVRSACAIDPGTGKVTGSAAVIDGLITGIPVGGSTPLAAAPPPNTAVSLGPLGEVVLNRQTTDTNTGALTVDAVYISLLPGTPTAQVIRIASTTCTPTAPTTAARSSSSSPPNAAAGTGSSSQSGSSAPQVIAPVGGVATGGGPGPASPLGQLVLGLLGGALLTTGAVVGAVGYWRRFAVEE